jgi:very-short-patch-repair endonuclease
MLEQSGFQVIRFFNNDVLNDIDGVLEYIIQKIENA